VLLKLILQVELLVTGPCSLVAPGFVVNR